MRTTQKIGQVSLLFWLFIVLAGCQTMDPNFSSFLDSDSNFNIPEQIILPRDHSEIRGKSRAETNVYNAIELGKQKRYTEADKLLREVRGLQYKDGEAYRSITNALAVIALKRGDLGAFRRLAGELDILLGKPLRVPTKHLSIISLERAISGGPLPLNVPERFRQFRNNYFSNLSKTRKL